MEKLWDFWPKVTAVSLCRHSSPRVFVKCAVRIPITTRVNLRLKTGTLKHEAFCFGLVRWLRHPGVRGTSRSARVFVLFFSCVAVHGQKKAKQSYAGFGLFGCRMSSNLEYNTALTHKFSRVADLRRPCKNVSLPIKRRYTARHTFSLSLSASDLNPASQMVPEPQPYQVELMDPRPCPPKFRTRISPYLHKPEASMPVSYCITHPLTHPPSLSSIIL